MFEALQLSENHDENCLVFHIHNEINMMTASIFLQVLFGTTPTADLYDRHLEIRPAPTLQCRDIFSRM